MGRAERAAQSAIISQPFNTLATVMSSYYINGLMYIDALSMGDGTTTSSKLAKVPMLKVGGVSQSLPPVGSTAIIIYIGNNYERPFCVGFIESNISNSIASDDKRPRRPPMNMTR